MPAVIPEEIARIDVADDSPAVTAVVCTHNRYDVVTDALDSLEAQDLGQTKLEILVVDNSTDLNAQNTYWSSHSLPPNGRLIIDRPGLSHARNTALVEARAPVIAYLDDDAVAVPSWGLAIDEAFKEEPAAAVIGGPVETVWVGKFPEWIGAELRDEWFSDLDLGDQRRRLDEGERLAGTNIAFRRSAIEAAGGFDEFLGRIGNALLSHEDLTVMSRLEALGYAAFYEPRARVLHRPKSDCLTQTWQRRRAAWSAVSSALSKSEIMDSERCWDVLFEYLSGLPMEMRGVRGLFLDSPDSKVFRRQCQAISALVQFALNHGMDPEAR